MTKNGNHYLRYYLVEAANLIRLRDPVFRKVSIYNGRNGITSEKAIPAIKTAVDKTSKFFFQIGFSFIFIPFVKF